MKNLYIVIALLFAFIQGNCYAGNPIKPVSPLASSVSGSVIDLTNEGFKQKVFNYEKNKEWKFEGNVPVIIDFYASWCGPCRMLSPRVEEIAKEYAGKIVVYKVDTDREQLLSQTLGVQSLPTLLFIPVKGKPRASMGLVPKETLVKAINEILLVK